MRWTNPFDWIGSGQCLRSLEVLTGSFDTDRRMSAEKMRKGEPWCSDTGVQGNTSPGFTDVQHVTSRLKTVQRPKSSFFSR